VRRGSSQELWLEGATNLFFALLGCGQAGPTSGQADSRDESSRINRGCTAKLRRARSPSFDRWQCAERDSRRGHGDVSDK
jgi:hypothetical protein